VCSTKAIELERRSPRGETAEVLDTLLVVAGSAAGSAQVADGEGINATANFFKRAEAVKAGLNFRWSEHTAADKRDAEHVHSVHGDSFGEHVCPR
jgi:hypothetical protein